MNANIYPPLPSTTLTAPSYDTRFLTSPRPPVRVRRVSTGPRPPLSSRCSGCRSENLQRALPASGNGRSNGLGGRRRSGEGDARSGDSRCKRQTSESNPQRNLGQSSGETDGNESGVLKKSVQRMLQIGCFRNPG